MPYKNMVDIEPSIIQALLMRLILLIRRGKYRKALLLPLGKNRLQFSWGRSNRIELWRRSLLTGQLISRNQLHTTNCKIFAAKHCICVHTIQLLMHASATFIGKQTHSCYENILLKKLQKCVFLYEFNRKQHYQLNINC